MEEWSWERADERHLSGKLQGTKEVLGAMTLAEGRKTDEAEAWAGQPRGIDQVRLPLEAVGGRAQAHSSNTKGAWDVRSQTPP